MACVDLPALPLQLLLHRRPEWAAQPVAVVDRDKPQGVVQWANERAARAGVLVGQRYTAALSLCPSLRAAEVAPQEIQALVEALLGRLLVYTPGVEPCDDEPGVLWLDASGLGRLYPSATAWGQAVSDDLDGQGLVATVVVGYSRFGTYAVARASRASRRRVVVFAGETEEQATMRRVPLARVGLPPSARDSLAKLSVRTVGEFLQLPPGGVLRRFGREAHRLHRLGAGDLHAPLVSHFAEEIIERRVELDDAERDLERLGFLVKREIDPLLSRLAARGEALSELVLTLTLERRGEPQAALPTLEERLRPAAPTLDAVQLLGLLRLRLESLRLPSGVTRVEVRVLGVPATREQLQLFAQKPRRDPDAAARAIARVRASLGDGAVVRARLREGHLPEARFVWEPTDRVSLVAAPSLPPPSPSLPSRPLRPLVRRIEARPVALPPRPAREPDGWMPVGVEHGPAQRVVGPYLVSGGWWRAQIDRDYYFAELRSGAIFWVYYDRRRRRWYLQGRVA